MMEAELMELKKDVRDILDRVTKIETVLEMRAGFDTRLRELEKEQAACRKHPIVEHEKRLQDLESRQAKQEWMPIVLEKHGLRLQDLERNLAEQKGQAKILAIVASAVTSIVVSLIAGLILWQMKGG